MSYIYFDTLFFPAVKILGDRLSGDACASINNTFHPYTHDPLVHLYACMQKRTGALSLKGSYKTHSWKRIILLLNKALMLGNRAIEASQHRGAVLQPASKQPGRLIQWQVSIHWQTHAEKESQPVILHTQVKEYTFVVVLVVVSKTQDKKKLGKLLCWNTFHLKLTRHARVRTSDLQETCVFLLRIRYTSGVLWSLASQ